ncbi:hypothetical protein [Streptomyces sp. SPB78]|uniref:Protein transporter Sec31 n=1 Tax=Streptomyces phage SF3 TaxID=1690818 RepID=A0A0M5M0U6_9CAUD|nr:hypothetical protein [Streptomyces sp. SPB78]YP_009213196.1 hypothetical protein AVV12_gp69 [Streptomyces phage SF3]ALF00200.1 hypothetical protein SF3_690 [Streptomyces phage SF3]
MKNRSHPPAAETPPTIPGVRYRREERTRTVTTVINGEPRRTPETYHVYVPVPPRDFDRALLVGVTSVAVAVTTLSVAWSTASIGDLLGTVVFSAIAYGAAAVFDAAWITCMAIEWLDRYDQARAKGARTAGWWALAVAVAAIVAHGWIRGSFVIGCVGGAVSLIAKGLWVVVMRHFAVPLGEGPREWLRQRRAEIAAERAISAEAQRLDGARAYHAAVYGPTAATMQQLARMQGHSEDKPEQTPREAGELLASELADMPPTRAIRIVHESRPDLAPAELADVLRQYGQDVTELDVALVLGIARPPESGAPRTPAAPQPEAAAAPRDGHNNDPRPAQDPADRIVDNVLAGADLTAADAVRRVRDALPRHTSTQIAAQLTRCGFDKVTDGYVRTVNSRDRNRSTPKPTAVPEPPARPRPEPNGPYL